MILEKGKGSIGDMENDKERKLISVIVAAYNIEQYLPRCLDSLLAQTYRPLEIIVVDDGSVDSTGEICDKYGRENDSIKVIHRKNGGLSAARNSGLEAALGDFIGFVDGDDWVDPRMYEEMLSSCIQADAQLAACSYQEVGQGAKELKTTGKQMELSMEEAMELFVNGEDGHRIYNSVWSKLFAREIIKDLRFVEGKSSEDIIYTTWAIAKTAKCVWLDTSFYYYRIDRSGSIMNVKLEERRFQDEIPFWEEQVGYLKKLGLCELADKAAYRFYKRLLNYYLDFRHRGMTQAGKKIMVLLKNKEAEVVRVYKKDFVPAGDRMRMRMALLWPEGYDWMAGAYEKLVVPLKQNMRK